MIIFDYFICILDYYISLDILSNFFQKKSITPNKRFFSFLIAVTALFLFNILGIPWANSVVSIIIFGALIYYQFIIGLRIAMLFSTFVIAALVILEFISIYCIAYFIGYSISSIINSQTGFLVIVITSKTLYLLVSKLINHYMKSRENTTKYKTSFVFILPVVTLFILFSLLYFDTWIPPTQFNSALLMSICIMLIITNLIMFYIYDEQQKLVSQKILFLASETYIEEQNNLMTLHKQHVDEHAMLLHDHKNQLITLHSLLVLENNSAETYLNTLIGSLSQISGESIQYTTNDGINGILAYKFKECENDHIPLDIQVEYLKLDFISYANACAIFGNAIDNAIRSCKSVIQKGQPARIQISISAKNGMLTIGFKNTRSSSDPIHIVNDHIVSSKKNKNNHGYGLINMKKAVDLCDGMVSIDYTDTEFHVIVLLPIIYKR